MPRFGKDKDQARKEELDRQAAEEVERLTRRGGPPGMGGAAGGMGGFGGPPIGIPSPLERMAAEMADRPRPVQERREPRRAAPRPQQQAFTAMPSGGVGSSFGPGGLNPGPRGGAAAPPPPAFGGGALDDDLGGPVTGPPVYSGEPDEDEEMTITEMALMDYAERTGHNPEDLVIRYDASTAEEMRDAAMRQFYERQQSRPSGPATNNPFAPAGMRNRGSGPAPLRRNDDPKAVGGALAQRLANRRRREEEEARRARAAAEPASAKSDVAGDEGALARVLARRRQALGVDAASTTRVEPEVEEVEEVAPEVEEVAPAPLRAVPVDDVDEQDDEPAPAPVRRASASTRAAKTPATKKAAKTPATKKAAPAAKKSATAPAGKKTAAAKATAKTAKSKKAGATLAKTPAAKSPRATKAAATETAKKSARSTVFCIECGEKNPAIAKFCFNCGTRLAAPET